MEESFGYSAEPLICVNSEVCFISRRIHDFLVRQARRDLEAAVARHAAHLGVRVRKITLRDTASRWGSCTSSGGLNFSWRLIMAVPFVLDYLAAHEVAHLLHIKSFPRVLEGRGKPLQRRVGRRIVVEGAWNGLASDRSGQGLAS